MQVGKSAEALDLYERALKFAAGVPELQFPVMTYQALTGGTSRCSV
jgi:hypothetical protein